MGFPTDLKVYKYDCSMSEINNFFGGSQAILPTPFKGFTYFGLVAYMYEYIIIYFLQCQALYRLTCVDVDALDINDEQRDFDKCNFNTEMKVAMKHQTSPQDLLCMDCVEECTI